jgi:alpha-galactosidase
MLFPTSDGRRTRVQLEQSDDRLPLVLWTGIAAPHERAEEWPAHPLDPTMPLLGEHSQGRFTRPHLRGHRVHLDGGASAAGSSWTHRFTADDVRRTDELLVLTATDADAGLRLTFELEALVGGSLRARYAVTNTAPGLYLVHGLEVALPVPDHLTQVLDFTGRHERERTPQRHEVTDGLWLRESRGGRPGLAAATMAVIGTAGFSTTRGEVLGVHVAWSGNSVLRVERDGASGTTIGGGELLLPGEVGLAEGETYSSPWVFFTAADDGLDGLAASLHTYQRSLAAHPVSQPVLLNVWEAVYFDHDLERLRGIADRAARVGVERFVLDDGWFHSRRDDTAGLGDWWVDELVWPEGLVPLVDHVRELGMEFGLWFEPEMVNPDSELYREHPDWILSAGPRTPLLHRNQLVLDLARPEVWQHLFDSIDAILAAHPIDFVKWDHNRDLLEAGTGRRSGAPAVHEQTLAFYALLDALREAHPDVSWESCASGGGRVDLGVIDRVQRFWTSDMTDALARQQIQRWTTQLLAPEYVGAHVSSTVSHTTGRRLSVDFRCVTAIFGSFGIEWDLLQADEDELEQLADWVARYRRFRPLLHSGRVVRPESSDPTVLLHGVVGADREQALVAHVQLDESAHNRGVTVRVPGLDPERSYQLRWEGPVEQRGVSGSSPLPDTGPLGTSSASGRSLAERGFWIPRRKPETATLVHLTAS